MITIKLEHKSIGTGEHNFNLLFPNGVDILKDYNSQWVWEDFLNIILHVWRSINSGTLFDDGDTTKNILYPHVLVQLNIKRRTI